MPGPCFVCAAPVTGLRRSAFAGVRPVGAAAAVTHLPRLAGSPAMAPLRGRAAVAGPAALRASASSSPPRPPLAAPDAPPPPPPSSTAAPDGPTVIVVGAGVGGLSVATRLARAGGRVTLLEQTDTLGGRLCETRLGGGEGAMAGSSGGAVASADGAADTGGVGPFRFELGPSLYLLPEIYERTFAQLGERLGDWLDLRRVDPNYTVYFDDDAPREPLVVTASVEEMAASLGSAAYKRWLSFLASANVAFEVGFRSFVDRRGFPGRLTEVPDLLRMCFALGGNPLAPMDGWLRSVFRGLDKAGGTGTDGAGVVTEERLRAMASFQNLYVGLSPYSSPATFALLSSLEAKQGVFYPVGGMVRVAEALATIAERSGVTTRTSTRVTAVMPSADGKTAIGVTLSDGTFLPADVVVSNVDLPTAEASLLPTAGSVTPNNNPADPLVAASPPLPNRGIKPGRRYSSGVVSFLFATDQVWPQLSHHTIFAVTSSAEARRGAWEGLFEPGLHLPSPCNFYVHSPARTDASAAPPGGDAIMVLVPVGHLADDGEEGATPPAAALRELEARARATVVDRFEAAGMIGFAASIVSERAFTPAMWRARYGLARGAAFGLAHDALQLSLFRQGPRDAELTNVYHVGASARPGNGVPLVLIGAEHVAATVVERTPGLAEGAGVTASAGGVTQSERQ